MESFNPRSGNLDLMASLLDQKMPLMPWKDLFSLSLVQLARIRPQPLKGLTAASHWRLGAGHQLSVTNLFYIQAGAATLYLFHAENGKYRARLLEAVGEFYTGRWKKMEVRNAFGLDPEELGRRVEAFALAVRRGQRP